MVTRTQTRRHWVELRPDWRTAPVAFWVHRQADGRDWLAAGAFDPPAPASIGGRGFAFVCLEAAGVVLEFSSAAQIAHVVEVLSQRPLPTTRALSARRAPHVGPNGHWLSRLPAAVKRPKAREALVAALRALPVDAFAPTAEQVLRGVPPDRTPRARS